jgi:hypothetical protein
VTFQIYRARSEKDVFDCLSWLYDGFRIPGAGGGAIERTLQQ